MAAADAGVEGRSADIAFLVNSTYRDIIIKYVRCGEILPDMCLPDDFLSVQSDILALERDHRQRDACSKFLDYLEKSDRKEDYLLFLQILDKKRYTFLVKLLRGDSKIDPDTHKEHYRLIQFFSQDIASKVDLEGIFPRLIEDDWMDDEDKEHLRCILQNSGRIMAARWFVLTVLPRKKENWFKQFLQLLSDTDHTELVAWIDDRSSKEADGHIDGDHNMESESGEEEEEMEIGGVYHPSGGEDDVRMNVLSVSGDAYKSLDLMDPVPVKFQNYTLNFMKPEVGKAAVTTLYSREEHKDIYEDESSLNIPDPKRIADWIQSPGDQEMSTKFNRDPPDDISIGSSQEDNTLFDIDPDELITPELLKARDEQIVPLENRPYQEELARAARDGSNVIIIAPTGCGKTVVAMNIMQDHLLRLERMGQRGKIAFFANEVTLVDQQHELCRRHFSDDNRTMMIVGETKYKVRDPLPDLINNNDLLVMTPQIIVDALDSKTLPSLSVFTLIIFDECHHVRDRHPTNQIMSYYMEQKHCADDTRPLPQIVGLTASVGVGKQKELSEKEGATRHILKLCANMNATGGLITVLENKESLAQYANCVKTAIKMTPKRATDPFRECIVQNIMEKIEERILNKFVETQWSLKHIKNLEQEVNPCQEKGTAWYTQWLGKLRFEKFLRIKDSPDLRRVFLTCVKYLTVYNKALALNSDCRAYDAMLYLDANVKTLYPAQGFRTETDEWLHTLFQEQRKQLYSVSRPDVNVNPKLITLHLLIADQIKQKRESRILVLVQTRDLARALVQWMTDDINLKKLGPVVVTGCGASADKGGMTRAQQIEAVKTFKWGNNRVAVATSVAEEGMDVTRCSRVIRYEYVSNEIGMIQARGRASRVEGGTCFTVTESDALATKENTNFRLEDVMDQAVEYLQEVIKTDPEGFLHNLEELQRSQKTSLEQEKLRELSQPLSEETFDLRCYDCDVFAFSSNDIRVVANSHRLVVSDIWHLVDEEKPEKKEAFDSMQKVSYVHCKKCRTRWGSGVSYRGKQFVCVSIVNFMAYDRNNRRYYWPKWRKARFKCKDMPKDEDEIAMFSPRDAVSPSE